jgi:hypothetical protein
MGATNYLKDILSDRQKWSKAKEKREPYTNEMFVYLHRRLQQQGKQDMSAVLANAGMSIEQIAFRVGRSLPLVQHYLRETSMHVDLLTKYTTKGAQII